MVIKTSMKVPYRFLGAQRKIQGFHRTMPIPQTTVFASKKPAMFSPDGINLFKAIASKVEHRIHLFKCLVVTKGHTCIDKSKS